VNTFKQKPVRLVLEAEDKDKPITLLILRNTFNKAAKDLGFKGVTK
jgi:hypothetical protein